MSDKSTEVIATKRHGDVREDRPGITPSLPYLITLDLGSESMAACFQHRSGQRPIPIKLQALASELYPQEAGKTSLELLREDDGKTLSPRLRTRISLRERKQPTPLPPEHAAIRFEKGPGDSIFTFFHREGAALSSNLLIPNPKLLFQTGIREIVPWVPGPQGYEIQYEPAELLQHLTVQVVNNFVLRAKDIELEARRRGQPKLDPKLIHLTITVPNIYSLTHIKQLEDFVRAHTDVGWVSTMYESDAIAHFMLGRLADDPPEVVEIKKKIDGALEPSADGHQEVSYCRILTIDIGKGTTDISLFNYDRNHRANKFTHDVLGRTGRSHGGAKLSYIFAEHLHTRIQQVLDRFEADPSIAPAMKDAIKARRPYVSLKSQPDQASGRGSVLGAAEKLTEAIKHGLNEDYQFKDGTNLEPRVHDLAKVLRQEIAAASSIGPIIAGLSPSPQTSGASAPAIPPEAQKLLEQLTSLEKAIAVALRFPSELPSLSSARNTWSRLLSWRTKRAAAKPSDDAFHRLRALLDAYVQENVDQPLAWLLEMAKGREGVQKKGGSLFSSGDDLLPPDTTFVVVAGQASRFEPLRRAIRNWVKEQINISVEPGGNLLFLEGALAKFSCSFGAEWFFRAALRCNNPGEIMGTYGFLQRFAPHALVNVDMQEFNQKREQILELSDGDHWLIFQPRHFPPGRIPSAELSKDTVAYIRTFSFNRGGRVRFRYRGGGKGIEIAEGDGPFEEVVFESTFGDVGSEIDEIYVKTWPETVPNEWKP
jgi:hypothetical protein